MDLMLYYSIGIELFVVLKYNFIKMGSDAPPNKAVGSKLSSEIKDSIQEAITIMKYLSTKESYLRLECVDLSYKICRRHFVILKQDGRYIMDRQDTIVTQLDPNMELN